MFNKAQTVTSNTYELYHEFQNCTTNHMCLESDFLRGKTSVFRFTGECCIGIKP